MGTSAVSVTTHRFGATCVKASLPIGGPPGMKQEKLPIPGLDESSRGVQKRGALLRQTGDTGKKFLFITCASQCMRVAPSSDGHQMDNAEALSLVEQCLPKFVASGQKLDRAAIISVVAKPIASLWAGMGTVYKLTIGQTSSPPLAIVAKRVMLPSVCDSIGDRRKKDSYDVEAAFYSKGHAEKLIAARALVPQPLHVESRDGGVTICMTCLEGSSSARGGEEAFMTWLARLHATYWGSRADAACGPTGGLQLNGCYCLPARGVNLAPQSSQTPYAVRLTARVSMAM